MKAAKDIMKPIEKFVGKELKDNCSLWDVEYDKFNSRVLQSIEDKLGIFQLPSILEEDFTATAGEVVKTLSRGCGSIGFLYGVHFSLQSFIKHSIDVTVDELLTSPVILKKNDWLFYFEKEKKFSGRLSGTLGADLAHYFFIPVITSNDKKGGLLVKGKISYSEESKFLPGLKPLKSGEIEFENFEFEEAIHFFEEGDWFEEFKSWFLYYVLHMFQGLIERAYEISKDYANERYQGGVKIIEIPSVKRLLSTIGTAISTLSSSLQGFSFEGKDWIFNIRKLYLALVDLSEEAILNAIQSMGGYGYMQDYGVERILRDFRSIRSIFSPLEYL